jgi:hypothetical protein
MQGSLVLMIFAVSLFACSSQSLAGDEIGKAVPQLAQLEENPIQGPAQPTPNWVGQYSAPHSGVKVSQRDWASLFESLLTSPERTQLAGDVGEALRRKDLSGAGRRLDAAVSAGTLAILIRDDIQDPVLQYLLQAVARERSDSRLASGLPPAGVGSVAGDSGVRGDAAEKERVRAEAALQELRTLQEQLAVSRKNEARVGELEHELEREKGRTASAVQDLNALHGQLTAMAQDKISAAEMRDAYAREAEQGKAAVSELASKLTAAQQQLAILEGRATEARELRLALEQERNAAEVAAGEIDSLRRELVLRQSGGVSPAGAGSSAAQEQKRAGAALEQSGTVRDELTALEESRAKMQGELDHERERSTSLSHQLAISQREILALKAQAAGAATTQEALRHEKEKTAAALRDLEAVKRQVKDLEVRPGFVPAAVIFQFNPVVLKPSPNTFQNGASLKSGTIAKDNISQRTVRQAALPRQLETERTFTDRANVQVHRRNPQLRPVEEPVGPALTRPKPNKAVGSSTIVKLQRTPSVTTRMNSAPEPIAPGLPASLLPVDGRWALY